MLDEVSRALENGATVITAGRRLARVLVQQFHSNQRRRARPVWKRPDVLPLDAFLNRAWWKWIFSGPAETAALLLSPLQEELIWEQVIRESAAGQTLLRIPETARLAMATWKLVKAYRLPVDGRFEATEDWSAFAEWSRAFQRRCLLNHWIESASLGDFLMPRTARLDHYYIAGFEDLTPQQSEFFATLGEFSQLDSMRHSARRKSFKLLDSAAELNAAAAWARERLEENPEAHIGVIVPDLTRLRPKVERIFREELGAVDAFHLSLGPPLSEYPLIRAALLILRFGLDNLTLPDAGMLIRSPFLLGGTDEWTKRAAVDARMRRDGMWDVTRSRLYDAAGSCSLLQTALRRFEKVLQEIPERQAGSEWSFDFSKLLEAMGWPGGRTLSSTEYQVVEQWKGLLSQLATLDVAAAPMSFDEAVTRTRQVAEVTLFQVENEDAPVEIMGLLEASGLNFDSLWVTGLHDQALPLATKANPFLPLSLQREYKLPHSSAENELDFANRILDGLLVSTPQIVLSYPRAEGDRTLLPSPLLPANEWAHYTASLWSPSAAPSFELLLDERAPGLAADSMQPGGASLFKDMAACPFRAFAKHRLGARPLEKADLGLSYKDRGTGIHKALELIWTELGSLARLQALDSGELRELIERNVRTALHHPGGGIGRRLEQRRLENLMLQWLEIEKTRAPFTVSKPEQERLVDIGGLRIRTRADRVDELESGGAVILDYKTGQLKTGGWEGDRPDEPQLPLYCATSEKPIAGAAFAIIRTGELGFKGLTENSVALPGLKKMAFEQPRSFNAQTLEWKRVLERLAVNYRSGIADVDPKRDACEFCGLQALCRIQEFKNDRG